MSVNDDANYEHISGQSQGDDERYDLREEIKAVFNSDLSDNDSCISSSSSKPKSVV